jgi:hypothetical protein
MLHQDQVEQGRKLLAYLDTNTSRPSQRGNGYTRRKQLVREHKVLPPPARSSSV